MNDETPIPPTAERPEHDLLPVWALREKTLFPQMLIPLLATRPMSVQAVEAALTREDKMLLVVMQRDPSVDTPDLDDLHTIGVRAVIKKMQRSDDGLQVLVQGVDRVQLLEITAKTPFIQGSVRVLPPPDDDDTEIEALDRTVRDQVRRVQKLSDPQVAMGLDQVLRSVDEPRRLAYLLTAAMNLKPEDEQSLLEASTRKDALRKISGHLMHEIQVLELQSQIAGQVQSELGQRQRQQLLREQLKAIQKELGEGGDDAGGEAAELRERLDEAELPDDVRTEVERELSRLERLHPSAPDYQVTRGYIELCLELPWSKATEDKLDLKRARAILDEDHYGLDDVKERILEYLAVLKLNPEAKSPILCFVGPPGTGKTSLGRSIARSIGRQFERMALGGLHDESELRGHRRTYIGAMPGRILQAVRRAGVKNPLLMLDEVDKLGSGFRGDPAAALMEILDPSQNDQFRDNYLNLPFDLSKVFFICTANTLETLPGPLLDRMEVIRVDGYTDAEKIEIARRYLIPRRMREAGIDPDRIAIDDGTLLTVIRGYTMEAGLRQLERALGKLARKVAYRQASADGDTSGPIELDAELVRELLGASWNRDEPLRRRAPAGVCAGLAWTPYGGDVLYIEAALLPYNTGFTLTGQLGNVMKESAQAAMSYVLSQARTLEIPRERILDSGLHVHVPQGAIPKDGPSAGITIATALASAYTGLPVRDDVAMTGELTLTGLVLPIGGLKQKAMAAHRIGVKTVIAPYENRNALDEIPESVRDALEFVWVERVEEVLAVAIPELAERLIACRLDWEDPSDAELESREVPEIEVADEADSAIAVEQAE